MFIFLRNRIYDILNNPTYNYAAAWVSTAVFAFLSLLTGLVFPAYFVLALIISIHVSLDAWCWYYSDWIENSLRDQKREAIGNRAILINLRVAIFGALSAVFVVVVITLALNRDLTLTNLGMYYGLWAVAIPLSFVSDQVKRFLLVTLKEVFSIPFKIAFVWMAITNEEYQLDGKFGQVSNVARKLFSAISGYPSSLSLLHETDYILRHLPSRR